MKVILLGELRGKGGEGDIIDVAQGYAENYLFPNGIAQPATPGNIKQLEQRRNNIAIREAKRISDAEALREQLDGKVVVVDVKIGDEGQLFGSVTNTMVGDALKEQFGIEIDRKRIEINKPIKTAGLHEVIVGIYRNIFATIGVQVGAPEDLPAGDEDVPADEEIVAEDASETTEAEEA
ncbi:50S ribosomal protein L9 [Atopobiaceae bacterium 24-176]